MGQVCAKHNEFYETQCRWCERPHPMAGVALYMYVGAPVLIDMSTPTEWLKRPYLLKPKAEEPDLSESPLDRHGGLE